MVDPKSNNNLKHMLEQLIEQPNSQPLIEQTMSMLLDAYKGDKTMYLVK